MNEEQAMRLVVALKLAVTAPTEEKSKEYTATAVRLAAKMTLEEIQLCKQAVKDALELGKA